jgi:hypothetical protein
VTIDPKKIRRPAVQEALKELTEPPPIVDPEDRERRRRLRVAEPQEIP